MKPLAALFLALCACGPAMAQPAQETLADAVASALASNPVLMGQRQVRALANETLAQAKSGLLPTVGFNSTVGSQGLEYGRTVSTPTGSFPIDGWQERATLGLEARQTLYAGGSLSAQRDQAKAGVDAAEAQLRSAEQELILSVVTAFVDVRRAEQEVDIRQTNVSALDQQMRAANERFSAGEVTRTDVAQAQARRAGAESELAASRASLENSRAGYVQIVGRPPIQLLAPPVAPPLPATLVEAVSTGQVFNPQVLAARAAERAAEEGIDIAKGNLRPRVGVVGNAGMQETYQDKTFRDTNMGLTLELSIPLYQGGLLASRTRAARLESSRARYNRFAVEREMTAQVTRAWHAVIASREAIVASNSQVAASDIALQGAVQELAVGTRTTLDVLDQERELLQARLALADAERAYYIASHQLLAAIGKLRVEAVSR